MFRLSLLNRNVGILPQIIHKLSLINRCYKSIILTTSFLWKVADKNSHKLSNHGMEDEILTNDILSYSPFLASVRLGGMDQCNASVVGMAIALDNEHPGDSSGLALCSPTRR